MSNYLKTNNLILKGKINLFSNANLQIDNQESSNSLSQQENPNNTKYGYFSGYASVFNIVDSQKDIVKPGCFENSLNKSRSSYIKMLWQHQPEQPIGIFDEIREDNRGLYVSGRILLDLPQGRDAYHLIKEGAIDGLSIGFRAVKYSYRPSSSVRIISEADLLEISIVTFPANNNAVIHHVKAFANDSNDNISSSDIGMADSQPLIASLENAIAVLYNLNHNNNR